MWWSSCTSGWRFCLRKCKPVLSGQRPLVAAVRPRYEKGKGVSQDYVLARNWYLKAAENGDVFAMTNLGALYNNGQGGGQDYAMARKWYEKAAEKGEATAMLGLGILYDKGHGVARSTAKAHEWYTKAAAAGSEKAKRFLKQN